jgi:hypothetical protein
MSRSLAIAPDQSWAVLGTEWWLRRYQQDGQLKWQKPSPSVTRQVNISGDGRMVVAGFGDGTVRWYRAVDGEELLALFVAPKNVKQWVAWTPQGYYDAGPAGEELVGIHMNHGVEQAASFVTAAHVSQMFRNPQIVSRALEGNQVAAPTGWSEALPPAVRILSPENGAEVDQPLALLRVSLQSLSSAPPSALSVLVNGGKLLELPLAGIRQEEELLLALPLPPEQVTLELLARTERSQFGAPTTVSVHRKNQAGPLSQSDVLAEPDRRPRLFLLAVGVTRYKQPQFNDLSYPADDAAEIVSAFAQQGGTGHLYRAVMTHLLTNGEATHDRIRDELEWLEQQAQDARDFTVLYLAGHAMRHPEYQNYLFLPHDADRDHIKRTVIDNKDLISTLGHTRGRRVLLLDTCFAAQVGAADRLRASNSSAIDDVVNDLAKGEAGAVVFAAAGENETARERDELKHGVFTYALLEALSGQASSEFAPQSAAGTAFQALHRSRRLSLLWLNTYVTERVSELTSKKQIPKFNKPFAKDPDDFVLAILP